MKRYLAVIEVDVWAEDDLAAAWEAVKRLRNLEEPQVYLRPIDDSLEHWVGVDFQDMSNDGQPYVGAAKPLCFDFID